MIAGGLLGAAAGALQAASRTLLVHQAEGRVAPTQAFGLFALSGRATAFVGPLLVAAVTAATGSQRLGVSPVILLFLLSLGLLYWVKTDNEQPGISRMIRRIVATCLALAALAAPVGGRDRDVALRAEGHAVAPSARLDRPARPRLPRRRRRASRVRADLAGDAPRPQPPLGQPGDRSPSSRT